MTAHTQANEPRLIVCERCKRPLADHCKKHYDPCCPGHCRGTKRGYSVFTDSQPVVPAAGDPT